SPEQHRHRAAGSVRPPAAWVSARSAWDPVAPAAARPCRRAGAPLVGRTPRTAYSANRPPRQPAAAYRARTALPQCWTSPDPRTDPAQRPLPGVSTTHTSWHCHHHEPASGHGHSATFSGPASPSIVDVPYVDDMSSLDHPTVAKVAAALSESGHHTAVEGITILPDEVRTASQAAAALGIDVGAIANSLVFRGVTTRSDGTEEHF